MRKKNVFAIYPHYEEGVLEWIAVCMYDSKEKECIQDWVFTRGEGANCTRFSRTSVRPLGEPLAWKWSDDGWNAVFEHITELVSLTEGGLLFAEAIVVPKNTGIVRQLDVLKELADLYHFQFVETDFAVFTSDSDVVDTCLKQAGLSFDDHAFRRFPYARMLLAKHLNLIGTAIAV